jgi:hypothetical protein
LQTLFGEDEIAMVLFFLEEDCETNQEVNYQLINFTGTLHLSITSYYYAETKLTSKTSTKQTQKTPI